MHRFDQCIGDCRGIRRNDTDGELVFFDDHVAALAADRARIAAAIRAKYDGHEWMIARLDDLLRVVEGG